MQGNYHHPPHHNYNHHNNESQCFIIIILIIGICEVLQCPSCMKQAKCWRWHIWMTWTVPFRSHIIWMTWIFEHLKIWTVPSRSRILNSLSVLTKSAAQMVLQTTIMMITWSVGLNIMMVMMVSLNDQYYHVTTTPITYYFTRYQKSLGYHIYLPVSAALA